MFNFLQSVVHWYDSQTARQLAVLILPWVLSSLTITMTVMTGNKHSKSWLVGLASQLLWTTWILLSQTWGLIPLNLTLWVLYYRNHQKWSKENKVLDGKLQFIETRPRPLARYLSRR